MRLEIDVQQLIEYIVIGIVGLSGLIQISPIKINPWTAIGRWIGRMINGELMDKVDRLDDKIEDLEFKHDESEARAARIRILRFGDELYLGTHHSKEHFDNILQDITEYETYCKEHPEFKNERTKATERLIKDRYEECIRERKFLT